MPSRSIGFDLLINTWEDGECELPGGSLSHTSMASSEKELDTLSLAAQGQEHSPTIIQ